MESNTRLARSKRHRSNSNGRSSNKKLKESQETNQKVKRSIDSKRSLLGKKRNVARKITGSFKNPSPAPVENTSRNILAPEESMKCTICLDTEDIQEMRASPCGHTFHRVCLERWLRSRNACPVCRTSCVDSLPTHYHRESQPSEVRRQQTRNHAVFGLSTRSINGDNISLVFRQTARNGHFSISIRNGILSYVSNTVRSTSLRLRQNAPFSVEF